MIFAVLQLHTVHDDQTVPYDHAAAKHKLKCDHDTVSSCLLETGNEVISNLSTRCRQNRKVMYVSELQDQVS